jgi:glycosyltransferase involved in cell wall biosynthesis
MERARLPDGRASSIVAIVAARRAAAYVGRCVEALKAAGFSENDIIVVDDASEDGTADLASARGVRVLSLPETSGAAAARNAGAAATTADILFFPDADCLVIPTCGR